MTKSVFKITDQGNNLRFERIVAARPEDIWAGWTSPDLIKKWFCPKPWATVECDIDLRPGGRFRTVMLSPEGERVEGEGCYLEIVTNKRIVWTSALGPGFCPQIVPKGGFVFTAVVEFEPHQLGTKYQATVMHASPADLEVHKSMGFHEGWNAALDQLLELIK